MATFDVASAAAANSAIAGAVSGDVIRFLDSGSFGGVDITVSVAGLTLTGQTPKANGPRRILVNANNTTIRDLLIQCDEVRSTAFVPAVNRTRSLIYAASAGAAAGLVIDNCRIRAGDSRNGFVDFDPTNDSYSSYGPLGGSTTMNDMFNEARLIELNRHRGSFTLTNTELSDCSDAIKFSCDGNATVDFVIRGNTLRRVYQDFISIGVAPQSSLSDQFIVTQCLIENNIFMDGFAAPQDNCNPHGDYIQLFSADRDSSPVFYTKNPWTNVAIRRNIMLQAPGSRGYPQAIFMSDIPADYPFVGPIVEDNICFNRIDIKGIEMFNVVSGFGSTGAFSARVRRNVMLSNPKYNTPTLRESTANVSPNADNTGTLSIAGKTGPAARFINIVPDATYPSMSLVIDNITERLVYASTNDTQGRQNTITGLGDAAGDYDAIFTSRPDWDNLNDAQAAIDACKLLIPSLSSRNPVASTSVTVSDFFAQPNMAAPKWFGFAPTINAPFSTVVESPWSMCHGDISIESISNGEYRIADNYTGTSGVTSWSTSVATIPSGKFIQVRATSGSAQLDTTYVTVTHDGGVKTVWTLTTQSVTEFPRAIFNTTGRYVASALLSSTPTSAGTFAFRVERATAPPSTERIIASTATASFPIGAIIDTAGRVRVVLTNSTGTTILDWRTTNSVVGSACEIIVSFDLSIPIEEGGFVAYANGVSQQNPTVFTLGGQVAWNRAGHIMTIGGNGVSAGTSRLNATLDYVWIQPGEKINIEDLDVRSRFNAARILPDGSGPFNEARQPVIFLTGRSGSTYANYGSGPSFSLTGTALSMANAADWPAAVNQYGPLEITVTDAATSTASTVPAYLTVANP